MKIVARQEFLAFPEGTLFSKYAPCYFGDLCIKGESLSTSTGVGDFMYQDLVGAFDYQNSNEMVDLLDESLHTGRSLAMDFECQSRDGCYDEEQLFAVWERKDVWQLISRLMASQDPPMDAAPSPPDR